MAAVPMNPRCSAINKGLNMHTTQSNKVLFVLTSHDKKGATGQPTGFYLSEASHPHKVLVDGGYDVDFISPQGGEPPVDGMDLDDPVNRTFWQDDAIRAALRATKTPANVHAEYYAAIFFAGGHGTMWDFPGNADLQALTAAVYERGGIVGAVCHGPAALVNVRLSDGRYLVDGKTVAAFTDDEERAVALEGVVPFLLASTFEKRGARHEAAANFQPKVVVSERLVTGQNPASAAGVGQAMCELLDARDDA